MYTDGTYIYIYTYTNKHIHKYIHIYAYNYKTWQNRTYIHGNIHAS